MVAALRRSPAQGTTNVEQALYHRWSLKRHQPRIFSKIRTPGEIRCGQTAQLLLGS